MSFHHWSFGPNMNAMHVTKLNEEAMVFVGDAYDANSLILLRGREALLVDAVGSADDAERLRLFIEERLEARVRFIVATHYFSDHMAALRSFPDAEIIAHENYLHTFTTERFRTPAETLHFAEPSITVADRMTLRWGAHTLEIFHSPGHTMSTMGVDIAEADLLHVGDSVVGNIVYLAYASTDLIEQTLKRFRRPARRRLLTSHGDAREGPILDYALHYLATLGDLALDAFEKDDDGKSLRELPLARCLAPGLEPTAWEDIFHRRNLESIIERRLFTHQVIAC
jgi:cyclase